MTHSPRILILYTAIGTGHFRAAEAIAASMTKHGVFTSIKDTTLFMHPLFQRIYIGGALRLIIRAPYLYEFLYRLTDRLAIERLVSTPRKHLETVSGKQLLNFIKSFRPDAVICTHFLPAELCASWRRSGELTTPVYAVVTDFEPHRFWQHHGIDIYYVANPTAADRLVKDGFERSDICVTGIPIQREFSRLHDRNQIAAELKLDPRHPILLIMGGGLGIGQLESVGRALLQQPIDAQIVFITGNNYNLRCRLQQMSSNWTIHGLVDNMPDWLAVTDTAISKAGALSLSELMASGVPTIIPSSLTGHEAVNAKYMAITGAAVLVKSAQAAVQRALFLLENPEVRESMRSAALRAAYPNSAEVVTKHMLQQHRT